LIEKPLQLASSSASDQDILWEEEMMLLQNLRDCSAYPTFRAIMQRMKAEGCCKVCWKRVVWSSVRLFFENSHNKEVLLFSMRQYLRNNFSSPAYEQDPELQRRSRSWGITPKSIAWLVVRYQDRKLGRSTVYLSQHLVDHKISCRIILLVQ
jgi:hypothetical protein